MIYYIKHFKRIGSTCTQADVELPRVRAIYHQQDMEGSHKDRNVVPTVNPRDWPKTLETVEDYIREFCREDGKPLSYRLRVDLMSPVAANYPTYRTSGSEEFTHDE